MAEEKEKRRRGILFSAGQKSLAKNPMYAVAYHDEQEPHHVRRGKFYVRYFYDEQLSDPVKLRIKGMDEELKGEKSPHLLTFMRCLD